MAYPYGNTWRAETVTGERCLRGNGAGGEFQRHPSGPAGHTSVVDRIMISINVGSRAWHHDRHGVVRSGRGQLLAPGY
jgi:hypothetical protein